MRVGDRYVIEIWGPWKGAVEVVDVSARSFRLATLEGHLESGVLEMRTSARRRSRRQKSSSRSNRGRAATTASST